MPEGAFGRSYLGWDTRQAVLDEPIVVLHHPDGDFMRISKGAIIDVSADSFFLGYKNQIEVLYEDGGTEDGYHRGPHGPGHMERSGVVGHQ